MGWKTALRRIDAVFEEGKWNILENLISRYESRFQENEAAMDALDDWFESPYVQNSLPATFGR